MKRETNCAICGTPLRGLQRKFCSRRCVNRFHQCYPAQKRRGLIRKLAFLVEMGSRCSRCGYDKNLGALVFHHTGEKRIKLDMRNLSNRKLDPIRKELRHVTLLCHNCHAELHCPDLDLKRLSIEPTALTTELRARSREGG